MMNRCQILAYRYLQSEGITSIPKIFYAEQQQSNKLTLIMQNLSIGHKMLKRQNQLDFKKISNLFKEMAVIHSKSFSKAETIKEFCYLHEAYELRYKSYNSETRKLIWKKHLQNCHKCLRISIQQQVHLRIKILTFLKILIINKLQKIMFLLILKPRMNPNKNIVFYKMILYMKIFFLMRMMEQKQQIGKQYEKVNHYGILVDLVCQIYRKVNGKIIFWI